MMLKIGERILDLELTHIFKNRIVLQKNNSTFQIFLGRGNIVSLRERPKKNPQKIQRPQKREERKTSTIRKIGDYFPFEVLDGLLFIWSEVVYDQHD